MDFFKLKKEEKEEDIYPNTIFKRVYHNNDILMNG